MPEISTEEDQMCPISAVTNNNRTIYRVAMDKVGPLPRSRSGNKYIFILCGYETKYPEAIPLKRSTC